MENLSRYIIESISHEKEKVNAMNAYVASFNKQMKGNKHIKDIEDEDKIGFEIIDSTKKYPVVTITFGWLDNNVEVYYFVMGVGETHYEYDDKTVNKDVMDIMKFVHLDK